nr:PREDICTED: tudor domain-containing protein 15 isoform X1 [Anolis carolinensis]|eukprot:XP_016852408.1 PREDICTED: tudor domain-containing protein 15 isoform X1 [Anolis carolinensis]
MDSSFSTKFLEVDVKVTDIYYHPNEVLVKFQGQYYTECELDYHILQSEIQQVPKVKDSIGIGEACLVEDPSSGEWSRGRVVQKKIYIYEVFLIDSGKVLTVHETHIASATDELFQLPPKMVLGIFANVLPVDEKWTPKALNYFSAFRNMRIKGQIQAILPHQTFLLDVPKITNDVVDLKLGKVVDGDTFCLIVEMLTEFPKESLCKQMPDLLQQKYTKPDSVLFSAGTEPEQILQSLQPLLSVDKMEKVKITVAVSPSKFYCQLLRKKVDLDMLATRMSSFYEFVNTENVLSFESLGVLCAARRKNGQWHRGVIQQLLPDNKVKVWFMDFGSCEAISPSHILKLQPEFNSMPGFSFACALSCLNDQEETVRHNQLEIFKETLLRQSPIYVQIDLFNDEECLYYVTLHKHSIVNTEHLPQEDDVVPQCCPVNKEPFYTCRDTTSGASMAFSECSFRNTLESGHSSDERVSPLVCWPSKIPFKTTEMEIDSICLAFTVHVLNPSRFWVRTNDCRDSFEALMKKIADAYDVDETDDKILKNPEPGKLCCARSGQDKHFYRAVIVEVKNRSVAVGFLDFGNTEIVPLCDVRILLPELQELPALAIYCSLANALPIEDVWLNKDSNFFENIVAGKVLRLHPTAKKENQYIVHVQCENGPEQGDVLQLMVQAGHAGCWEIKQDPLLKVISVYTEHKTERANIKSCTQENKIVTCNNAGQNKKLLKIHHVIKESGFSSMQTESSLFNKCEITFEKTDIQKTYKVFTFEPGTVLDVVCSHSFSPGHFSCQIKNKLPELNNLMERIQLYYNAQNTPYENGHIACVVKHSQNGKWYRAAVLKHLSTTEVNVLFVDYGNCEKVLLKDLRAIIPDFLTLESQTFTCCPNIVAKSLIFDPFSWSEKAYSDFQHFISSSNELLTCTITALIVKSPHYLYYVVELRTPFTSLQQFLLERGHIQFDSFEFARSLTPFLSLHSFYYSLFNIKIGNEEEVCVSHICSPTEFYCQLTRNAEDIDKLLKKVTEIIQMTNRTDEISTKICLAKYFEDGLFYRALAFPVESSDYYQVYFVDFGNKQLVAKNELVAIPEHASELFFTPMQAIRCYLSDLKDIEIPLEINKWFEKNYLGENLKAVIVSKDSDGQLAVELYDRDLQINRKIKELLKQNKCNKDLKVISKGREKSAMKKKIIPEVKLNEDRANVKNKVKMNRSSENNASGEKFYKSGKEILVLQKQPVRLPLKSKKAEMLIQGVNRPNKKLDVHENKTTESLVLPLSSPKQERSSACREKYSNLKQHPIKANSKILGYISFVTNPLSFYVHCAEHEDMIVNLAEKLNEGMLTLEPETVADLEIGDVVLAQYELDCCIYRAVVKEIKSEECFEIEFIDYGNTSTVNSSKIYKMEKDFLKFPRLSIHCFLSKAKDKSWSRDAAAYLSSKIDDQLLVFEFLQQHDQQWEINVFCNGVSIISELMQREVSINLEKIPVISHHQISSQPLISGADICKNCPAEKTEHENMWQSLSQIPYQKIKPGQKEIGEIQYMSRNGNFYVILNKDAQILVDLSVMAAQEARKNFSVAVENIAEGLECLTKSQETLKWYRSVVVKKISNQHMLVFFMDLGKLEIVSIHDVRMLSGKTRSVPRNAVLCKWIWIENVGSLFYETMASILKQHIIKFLFLKYLELASIWEVDILIDEILLLEYWSQHFLHNSLERSNISENLLIDKTVPELSFRPHSVVWTSFQTNRQYAGFITSVTDPSDFYIKLEDSFKDLHTLFMLLSSLPENLPPMPEKFIVPGACCLMKTEANAEWNRVEVFEISRVSNMLILTFVDDGLSGSIPISDIHKLKIIPEKLLSLPRLTYPSCLFRVSPAGGNNWNYDAKLKFLEFLRRKDLTFQFRRHHHGLKLGVDVFCEQDNAADTLVSSGCAVYTTTDSFESIHCSNTGFLNSQNLCDLSQASDQKNSNAGSLLSNLQKLDLPFKSVGDDISRKNPSKKQRSKKKRDQKTFPCDYRINDGIWFNFDKGVFDHLCNRKQTAVSELTTKIAKIQVHEESQTHKYLMREVSFKCFLKWLLLLLPILVAK